MEYLCYYNEDEKQVKEQQKQEAQQQKQSSGATMQNYPMGMMLNNQMVVPQNYPMGMPQNYQIGAVQNYQRGVETSPQVIRVRAGKQTRTRVKEGVPYIAVTVYQHPLFVIPFENGESRSEILSYELYGFANVSVGSYGCKEILIVEWGDRYIINDVENLSEKKIADSFVKAGVRLNPNIPKGKMQKALKLLFDLWVANCNHYVYLPVRSGWNKASKKFVTYGMNPVWDYILKKMQQPDQMIIVKGYDEKSVITYARTITKIKSAPLRIVLELVPFMSLIGSLIPDDKRGRTIFNLLMMTSDINAQKINRFFQLYNRGNRMELKTLDVSRRELEKMLIAKSDNLLMFQIREQRDSDYRKKKIAENIEFAKNVAMGDTRISESTTLTEGNLMFVSDTEIPETTSVYIDDEEAEILAEIDVEYDRVIGGVFWKFIQFVQANFDEILELIEEDNNPADALEITAQILMKFYGSCGINIQWLVEDKDSLADLCAMKQSEYYRIFLDQLFFEMKNFTVSHKKNCIHADIYYDDKYIWIPIYIYNQILDAAKITDKKLQVLAELFQNCFLEKEDGGYRSKLQVDGRRFYTVKLYRNAIDEYAGVNVVATGRKE